MDRKEFATGQHSNCLAQPRQTFGGEELYPSLPSKAAALGFFLVSNHPFVDGNKRIGHAALEVTLVLNGFELTAVQISDVRLSAPLGEVAEIRGVEGSGPSENQVLSKLFES